VKISGYMYKFQDLTPTSGHFRTNFKISGISGQRPGLLIQSQTEPETSKSHTTHTQGSHSFTDKKNPGARFTEDHRIILRQFPHLGHPKTMI